MRMRFSAFALLVALVFGPAIGCKKSNPDEKSQAETKKPTATPPPAPKTVARIHSLGLKRILADTNAACLKTIWDLPETVRLKDQTLDKLAISPWRNDVPELRSFIEKVSGPSTNQNLIFTNYPAMVAGHPLASKLRPILEDLLQEEVYLEARNVGSEPGEIFLGARLEDNRSSLWQANLQSVLETVSGTHALQTSNTFTLHLPNPLHAGGTAFQYPAANVSFSRAGAWSLLLISPDTNSTWLKEITARIQSNPAGIPFQASGTNACFEIDVQPLPFLAALGFKAALPAVLSEVSLSVLPNTTNLITAGKLQFSSPVPEVEKWTVPVGLIHEPLFSFTAVQGLKALLAQCPEWQSLQAGEPPNQFFMWGQSGSPFLDFFALPTPAASNIVDKVSDKLMQAFNPALTANRMGMLERATNYYGLTWEKVPILKPFLEAVGLDEGNFVFGGFAANTSTNNPPPAETLAALLNTPNLVYYDRENTGPRVESWLYVSQLFRIVLRHAQISPDSASLNWIKAILQKISPTTTMLVKTGSSELALHRESQMGLTSLELHVLVDWLESPTLPCGFHTTIRELTPLHPLRPGTNTSAATPKR